MGLCQGTHSHRQPAVDITSSWERHALSSVRSLKGTWASLLLVFVSLFGHSLLPVCPLLEDWTHTCGYIMSATCHFCLHPLQWSSLYGHCVHFCSFEHILVVVCCSLYLGLSVCWGKCWLVWTLRTLDMVHTLSLRTSACQSLAYHCWGVTCISGLHTPWKHPLLTGAFSLLSLCLWYGGQLLPIQVCKMLNCFMSCALRCSLHASITHDVSEERCGLMSYVLFPYCSHMSDWNAKWALCNWC